MGRRSDWAKTVYDRLAAALTVPGDAQGIYAGAAPQSVDSGDGNAFPYVLITTGDFFPYHDDAFTGWEVVQSVEVFSRSPGRKQCEDLLDLVIDALHRQQSNLSVAGHSVLHIDCERSSIDDPVDFDGAFQGVAELRAIVTKDAAD